MSNLFMTTKNPKPVLTYQSALIMYNQILAYNENPMQIPGSQGKFKKYAKWLPDEGCLTIKDAKGKLLDVIYIKERDLKNESEINDLRNIGKY